MNEIGFVAAAKQYFGQKDDQTSMDFLKEVKMLTPEDRANLTPLLEAELGVKIKKS